jgi:lysophospholipase L1-like esterase
METETSMSKGSNAGRPKGRRWWMKRLILAFLLALLALEGASRYVLGDLAELDLLEFWPNDGRSLGLKPGATAIYNGYFLKIPEVTMTVNELGYRGVQRPVTKTSGTYRIAIFGDSYTYGVGVEDDATSSVLLETRLRADGRSVEVLNFGIPGANAADLESQYELFISLWQPDLLILQVSPNDLDPPMFSRNDPVNPDAVSGVFQNIYAARVLFVGAFLAVTLFDAVFDLEERSAQETTREQIKTFRTWIGSLTSSARRHGTAVSVLVLGNPVEGASMERVLAIGHAGTNTTLDASVILAGEDYKIPNEGHFNVRGHERLSELLFGLVGEIVPAGEASAPDSSVSAVRSPMQ